MPATSSSQNADIKVLIVEMQGVREDVNEIKRDIKCLSEREAEFERHYTGEHVKVETAASAAHRRLDILEPKVSKIEDALHPLMIQARIIVWVATLLGVSIIGLIWAIIVGQAEVIFR